MPAARGRAMTLREKVARAIAKAQTGMDPDTRIVPFQPARAGASHFVVPPDDAIRPLWSCYLGSADAALKTVGDAFADVCVPEDATDADE